jgi:phosphoserine phosphatase RsbU/P
MVEEKSDLLSLVGHAEILQATDTLAAAHDAFAKSDQPYMAVFEDDQIIGLCSRRRVGMLLGSPAGFKQYSCRPVFEFLLPSMTVVRFGQPLVDVLMVVFSRPVEALLDDVVLMDDYGRFLGLIFSRDLVRVQYLLLQKKIRELEDSRRVIGEKNKEMENDLRMASEVQQALLPPALEVNGVNPLHVLHRYKPMGQVSGDFFHRLDLEPDKMGLFICDVMGHGVRSAFITAMLRTLIQEMLPLASRPGELLARMNNELKTILQQTDSPLYATAIYLMADASTGQVRFACAGHPDMVLISRATAQAKSVPPLPKTKGPALGMRAGASYGETEIILRPDEALLLFTDGLCEIFNEQDQEFGREQFMQAAQRRAALPLKSILDGIFADAQAFAGGKFQDDVCLIGIEWSPQAVVHFQAQEPPVPGTAALAVN